MCLLFFGSGLGGVVERKLFKSAKDIIFEHPIKGKIKFNKNNYTKIIRIIIIFGKNLKFYHQGRLTEKTSQFIHILQGNEFKNIIKELDTISDLTEYLTQREYLLNNTNKIVLFGSETELITAFKENRFAFAEFVKQQYNTNIILDLENYFNLNYS